MEWEAILPERKRDLCYLGRGLYCVSVGIWFFALLCVVAQPAYAYVDPGSGLFIIQTIASTFVGFAFLIRKRIRQTFRIFGVKPKESGKDIE